VYDRAVRFPWSNAYLDFTIGARACGCLAGLTLALAWASVGAATAAASLGELSFLGCIGQVTLSECAAVPSGFAGTVEEPKGLAVSPDGANVYAADDDASTIDVFSRNAVTGTLTLTSCIGQHAGCATTSPQSKAVERPFAVAVSPDGKDVYAVSVGSNSVDEFWRNDSNGELSYTGCIGQLAGCTPTTPTEAVSGPQSIAISADGTSVYVASENAGGAVDEFSREAASGTLTFAGCVGAGGCTPAPTETLRQANAVVISPDGSNVYVGGQGASISTFTRNTSTGAISFQRCTGNSNVCEQVSPLAVNEPTSLALSPDGTNLYAGNFANGALDVFSRNTATGALTFVGCNGALSGEPGACTEMPSGNPEGPLTVAISPDGADLYVSAEQGVYEYARGPAGALAFAGCTGSQPGVCTATVPAEALSFSVSLALSPNGASLYAGTEVARDLDVFGRETLPVGSLTSVSSKQTSTSTAASGSSSSAGIASTPRAIEELRLGCSKRSLVLNDVLVRGIRVDLQGSAAKSLDGKRVKIVFDGSKQVASATVGTDGEFATTAPLPPLRLRDSNSARYMAESGSQRSLNLKLARRLSLEPPTFSAGTVTLVGQVVPPLAKPASEVTVSQELECGKTTTAGRFKLSASGHFRIALKVPAAAQAGIYRLTSSVLEKPGAKRGFATYSLPLPVILG
jgi:DNA-binding beta-propeller fold protein YncE